MHDVLSEDQALGLTTMKEQHASTLGRLFIWRASHSVYNQRKSHGRVRLRARVYQSSKAPVPMFANSSLLLLDATSNYAYHAVPATSECGALSGGAIASIVIGCVIGIAILLALAALLLQRKLQARVRLHPSINPLTYCCPGYCHVDIPVPEY